MSLLHRWLASRGWDYYLYMGNWHKHPWVTSVLCWFGRHDYEMRRCGCSVWMECFYCLQEKNRPACNCREKANEDMG